MRPAWISEHDWESGLVVHPVKIYEIRKAGYARAAIWPAFPDKVIDICKEELWIENQLVLEGWMIGQPNILAGWFDGRDKRVVRVSCRHVLQHHWRVLEQLGDVYYLEEA